MMHTQSQASEVTQTILEQVNGHYKEVCSSLGFGSETIFDEEQDNLLALFIKRELRDVTSGYDDCDLASATDHAIRALRRADEELGEVIEVLSKLSSSEPVEKALSHADAAYYAGEARLAEGLELGQRGDTLADYIAESIQKTWYSAGDQVSSLACTHMLEQGRVVLDACIDGLVAMTPANRSAHAASMRA